MTLSQLHTGLQELDGPCCADRLVAAFQAALAWHKKAYPKGNWKAANDAIGACTGSADRLIRMGGLWPVGVHGDPKLYLCNAERIALLLALTSAMIEKDRSHD